MIQVAVTLSKRLNVAAQLKGAQTSCDPVTVKNSTNTYNVSVASGGTLTLPDVDNVDGDGTVVATPGQTPFVCQTLQELADGATEAALGAVLDNLAESKLAGALDVLSGTELSNVIVLLDAADKIAYRRPPLTGQTASYATEDDGWRLQNGIYTNTKQGKRPVLQGEDPTVRDGTINDWFKLSPSTPNAFGTLFVWTDSTGGQVFTNGGYIINHLTGQGWVRGISGVPVAAAGGIQLVDSITWASALTAVSGSSLHSFTDWYLPNVHEYLSVSFINATVNHSLNYSAMNITANWFFWTGTARQDSTTSAEQFRPQPSLMTVEIKTATRNYLMVRNHYTNI